MYGQLILMKIIKIVATRCQILRMKCTKFHFGWGSAPDPAGGAYIRSPHPVAGFKGPTSKGGEGKDGSGGRGRVPSTFSLWIYAHGACCGSSGENDFSDQSTEPFSRSSK